MPIRQFQAMRMQVPRHFSPIAPSPICLEIGAGKGKHALLFSQQYPEQTVYAIERTKEKYVVLQKQQLEQEQANLHPIHADALPWIVHAVYPQQIEQCFILYPNPEPHNPAQRWLNMPFFEFLLSRLNATGTLTLASNIAAYIDEAAEQLTQVWQLPFKREVIPVHYARTHFEIKYLSRGELCQQLIITKPKNYMTRFDQFTPLQGHPHV